MDWQAAPFTTSYGKHTVSGDGQAITVDGTRLALDDIDRLSTSFVRSRAQGSWGKLTAGAMISAGDTVAQLSLYGGQTDENTVEWGPMWDQLVSFLDAEVKPRIRT